MAGGIIRKTLCVTKGKKIIKITIYLRIDSVLEF